MTTDRDKTAPLFKRSLNKVSYASFELIAVLLILGVAWYHIRISAYHDKSCRKLQIFLYKSYYNSVKMVPCLMIARNYHLFKNGSFRCITNENVEKRLQHNDE